jgi:hypothetical protein
MKEKKFSSKFNFSLIARLLAIIFKYLDLDSACKLNADPDPSLVVVVEVSDSLRVLRRLDWPVQRLHGV